MPQFAVQTRFTAARVDQIGLDWVRCCPSNHVVFPHRLCKTSEQPFETIFSARVALTTHEPSWVVSRDTCTHSFRPLLRLLSPATATPRHSHPRNTGVLHIILFLSVSGGRLTPLLNDRQFSYSITSLYFPLAKVASPIHNRFPAQSNGRNLDRSRSRRRQFPHFLTLLRTCVVVLLCVPIWKQKISQTAHVSTKCR